MSGRVTELCRNVNYDKSSHYEWDHLNETTFLENVFNALRGEMGVKFDSYNWNILSSHDPDVVPMSAAGEADRKVLIFISMSYALSLNGCKSDILLYLSAIYRTKWRTPIFSPLILATLGMFRHFRLSK